MLWETIFFVAIGLIAVSYAGYPALLFLLSRRFSKPAIQAPITPRVSVIIAAHNEERDLAAKIENTLASDYPADRLEVIVASDCSTDGTDAIARRYAERGVILVRQPERRGKTAVQNRALEAASGEILIFTDATTRIRPDAVRRIVRSFADPRVGCVAAQLVYEQGAPTAASRGCRFYWGYEKFLRRCESALGSLVGVSGCFHAVRRECRPALDEDMIEDFVTPLELHRRGFRTVYDPQAVVAEDAHEESSREFRMRVRVMEQTLSALWRYRALLNPFRHGVFAWQLILHKVMRYSLPICLSAALVSSALLRGSSSLYRAAWLAQMALYGAAVAGWFCDRAGLRRGPLALPYYFLLANAALVSAFWRFARGEVRTVWEPVREPRVPQLDHDAL